MASSVWYVDIRICYSTLDMDCGFGSKNFSPLFTSRVTYADVHTGTVNLREGPFLYSIPQKAYILPRGTLREQVTYPSGANRGVSSYHVGEFGKD